MNEAEPRDTTPGLAGKNGPDQFGARRREFRTLHEGGCFVMANPWDVGSARYLQHLGFPAPALAAWTGFMRAAQALRSDGSFAGLAGLATHSDINGFLTADLSARRTRGI